MGYIILNPSNDLPEMSSGNTLITVNDNGYLILKIYRKIKEYESEKLFAL